MSLATRGRPSTSAPSDGSRTITIQDSQPIEDGTGPEGPGSSGAATVGSLRLRGAPRNRPRVVWSEDVVDNEHAGKKSSKICCIYHKPRKFDESSSEESSDSDSDSDHSCDHRHSHRHAHSHRHSDGNDNGTSVRNGTEGIVHSVSKDENEPNVYERLPGRKKGKAISKD